MLVREKLEKREHDLLSPFAKKADQSKGRAIAEEEDDYRTIFQRDRDRILHSKAFRRLKHKTQVFISPEGDHYRTRLTHTLEVSQIARTITRALDLNEDLVEAMALGHDVGHTPFGHAGEEVIRDFIPKFNHNEQSVRVLTLLESRPDRQGLNLSAEVLDGILNHTGSQQAQSLEGQVLKLADRIAYVNHDIDDAIRAGILVQEDLPEDCIQTLGQTSSERIDSMVHAVVEPSMGQDRIIMDPQVQAASAKLRAYLFQHVYVNEEVKGENRKLHHIIHEVFAHYFEHMEDLPQSHLRIYEQAGLDEPKERVIADYIAGMTDVFLIKTYKELFIPVAWNKM